MGYFFGAIHLLMACCGIIFLIQSYVRKNRLSKFQWAYMANLFAFQLLCATVLFGYFGIGGGYTDNCNFYNRVFYGSTDIFLFNVSILMGFKQFTVFSNMYQFTVKGNVPSESTKKCNKRCLNIIWMASISDFCIFVFLNTYYTFIHRNMTRLGLFNFVNRICQIVLIGLNGLLFIFAAVLMTKIMNFTLVDSKQKNLFRTKRLMMCFGCVYLCLSGVLTWSLYTQGFHNVNALLNYFA